MIIQSARLAASQLFEPQFRSVLWKSLGLTIAMLALAWLGLEWLASNLLETHLQSWPWVVRAISWLLGAGLIIGLGFLIGPVTAVFAGLFLDDVAERVEARHYPREAPGKPMPLVPSLLLSARFTLVVIVANLVALALVLLPGINFAIFFFVNAWLIGREYFTFAAMRFRPEEDARALREQNGGRIIMAGLVIAGFMAVPILNLLTPLFATAMMVHMHKALSGRTPHAERVGA